MEKGYEFEFAYQKQRPTATVHLSVDGVIGRYMKLLIDTGSDRSMLAASDAAFFGIDYDRLGVSKQDVELADSTCIQAKEVTLLLEMDSFTLSVPFLVTREYVQPLMGRRGVFDAFDVLFQQRGQRVLFRKH